MPPDLPWLCLKRDAASGHGVRRLLVCLVPDDHDKGSCGRGFSCG
ncbi:hypothetical protein FOPG_11208 [Fusarium oxysporum f. sp. conglutinans race 2 54008]|uniref:Uncharacterized protein n=3 Tax=Fusarium oxysporum TaxID=5507 RepID=X0LEY3_FUSOX|nr:hypothetical protein FOVG_05731 [Fusarium oxysporum f. sp. pisi HDV247]EXL73534.1 hypothetical protein FOPG_11208 [Fusarium oxysporum f. sp. conglutinans race 2 54008]EXM19707.1 hypothetical protein FOTG_12346 [Fusarium oxysporum f. sp. vasinfectum 25433]KAI8402878.1 hypothetical protein FOFC_16307 [Fusarium oxysporum]